MTPIEPLHNTGEQGHTMEPPFSDENPNLEAIRQGLGVAEDEVRDIVEETYGNADLRDEGPDFLDDEDELTGEETFQAPELAALHEGGGPRGVDPLNQDVAEVRQPDEEVQEAEEYDPEED